MFIRKIGLYVYYFVRSCRSRGLWATLQMMWHEYYQEKRWKINTLTIEELHGLELASTASEAHHYQAASYYVMQQLVKHLPFAPQQSTFIDFGAGKGRALLLAAEWGCKRVIGVELAKELCEFAQQNIAKVAHQFPNTQFEVVFCDATQYEIPRDAQLFYFFNPFGAGVLQQVLERIKQSVAQFPRPICILYLNPVYSQTVTEAGFKVHYTLKKWRYVEAVLYVG
ncbi:MAG: class I SAM-dependent methyltransferase [Chitinophagales bacterium]|nr:class I SAM-dependent methyltransferase [Chitinophagales bacterium]